MAATQLRSPQLTGVPGSIPITSQTASFTLALSAIGTLRNEGLVQCNSASAIVATVPTNATVAFPIGTVISLVQWGAGALSVAAASGVTIVNSSSLSARAQYSMLTLIQIAANTWLLTGDMT